MPSRSIDGVLLTVHEPEYVAAVRAAGADPSAADPLRGLGTDDDPAFAGMHEATARIVGGSLAAAQAVWRGEAAHGVNFTGGLHHAMAGRAERVLHLQRRRGRHPVAARPAAPRRSRTSTSTSTTATASRTCSGTTRGC